MIYKLNCLFSYSVKMIAFMFLWYSLWLVLEFISRSEYAKNSIEVPACKMREDQTRLPVASLDFYARRFTTSHLNKYTKICCSDFKYCKYFCSYIGLFNQNVWPTTNKITFIFNVLLKVKNCKILFFFE